MRYTSLEQLKLDALKSEELNIQIPLTDEELSALDTDISLKYSRFLDKKEEFSDIQKENNKFLKEQQEELNELVEERHLRHRSETCQCWLVYNDDSGMVDYVDEKTLQVVESRLPKPGEKKSTLRFANVINM